jgi:hypothetical protein
MPPRVSVLQLDTDFPRVAGDVGCADTYRGTVEIIRMPSATVGQVVSNRPDLIDIAPMEDALRRARGDLVVTSCGFLSYWQAHLAGLTDKPFISSALTALEDLSRSYAAGEILILTFDAASLTPLHLGAHADYATGMVGLPDDMHLKRVIRENQKTLDVERAGRELAAFIATAQKPHHKHILLECTNLPPYKAQMQAVTDLSITDILTCIEAAQLNTINPHFLPKKDIP